MAQIAQTNAMTSLTAAQERKANAEVANIVGDTALKASTAANYGQNTENLKQQFAKTLEEIKEVISRREGVDLDNKLKDRTMEERIRIVTAELRAKQAELPGKETRGSAWDQAGRVWRSFQDWANGPKINIKPFIDKMSPLKNAYDYMNSGTFKRNTGAGKFQPKKGR